MTLPDADVSVTTKGNPPVTTVEVVPVRNLFASKTAFANYLMGLMVVWPDGAAWIGAHVQIAMALFIATNLGLRKISHGKVELFPSAPADGGL